MVLLGESVRIKGVFVDMDGTATNPDSHSIKLFKPAGTQQGDTEITPTDSGTTGTHYQWFDIPSDGDEGTWRVEWTVVIANRTGIFQVMFRVAKSR